MSDKLFILDILDSNERSKAKKRSEESMHLMYSLQQDGTNCDATIYMDDGQFFPVHSAIMCRCSPYFQALFRKGDQRNRVNIPGIESGIMKLIIRYAYTREVNITIQNATDLMADADQLAILTLVETCGIFITKQLDSKNCLELYCFAQNYLLQKLADKAYQYTMRNFVSVCQEKTQLLKLTVEELTEILRSPELNVSDEAVVWETIINWIDFDPEEREKNLMTLMSTVRFGLMEPRYFREKVNHHPCVVKRKDECKPLIIQTLMYMDGLGLPGDVLYSQLCSTRLPHDLLFAVGGWSRGHPTEMVETYDIRLNKWTRIYIEDSPGPRAYHGCVVIGPELYVIGGFDGVEYFNGCWCYHVGTRVWKEIAPMHAQRCYVSVACLDGLIYAMGGYNGQHRQSTAEVYDRSTNQWKLISQMHFPRSDADATTYNKKVYIVGGFNGHTCMNSAECYDPVTDQWSLLTNMRAQRSGVSCIAYHGFIYVVGGFNGAMRLRSVEKYDVVRGIWITVPDMINARSNFGIEVLEDRIYAIGGFNGVTTVNEVEYFDICSNNWHASKRMNIVRSALAVCFVSGMENIYGYLEFDREENAPNDRRSSPGSNSSGASVDRSASE